MTHTTKQRDERRRTLLALAFEEDPAALISHESQRDEYACLVEPLLQMLENNAGENEVIQFVETLIQRHFGTLDCSKAREFATKAKAWHDRLGPAA